MPRWVSPRTMDTCGPALRYSSDSQLLHRFSCGGVSCSRQIVGVLRYGLDEQHHHIPLGDRTTASTSCAICELLQYLPSRLSYLIGAQQNRKDDWRCCCPWQQNRSLHLLTAICSPLSDGFSYIRTALAFSATAANTTDRGCPLSITCRPTTTTSSSRRWRAVVRPV